MKRRVAVRVALLLLATPLTGCVTTLSDLRATTPIREASVATPRPRAALAACAMDGMETGKTAATLGLVYRILDRAPEETSLTGQAPTVGSTVFEATFTTRGDAVAIATRADGPLGWGGIARDIEAAFWPIVERCAGTKIAVKPPLAE